MGMTRLSRDFYARPTPVVARALLGRRLVRLLDVDGAQRRRLSGRIVEVEAYTGADDAASHAHRGRTARNAPMFGPPGHAYVYFIYGMHWMFNVVAHQDPPGAVLVRALVPKEGHDVMRAHRGGCADDILTSGPARLAQALAIDGALSGIDLCSAEQLFIEPGTPVADESVACGPRVGVTGDAEAKTRPWRFWVK